MPVNMERPKVILHMASSIDGRIVAHGWPPQAHPGEAYERIHAELAGDAWIIGRVSMEEMAQGDPPPAQATEPIPRATWKAPGAQQGPYAIALDPGGKLRLGKGDVGGDPVVLVLSEEVGDDHLAELRRDGVSYLFAGRERIDLALALDILGQAFGIRTLLLEGGGGINGSFMAAGLIDEYSLIVLPLADGAKGLPTTIDRPPAMGAPQLLRLLSVDRLPGDLLHLRYEVAR